MGAAAGRIPLSFPPTPLMCTNAQSLAPETGLHRIWGGSVALVHTDIYGKVCWVLRCMSTGNEDKLSPN